MIVYKRFIFSIWHDRAESQFRPHDVITVGCWSIRSKHRSTPRGVISPQAYPERTFGPSECALSPRRLKTNRHDPLPETRSADQSAVAIPIGRDYLLSDYWGRSRPQTP